ncbi:putative zinc-binding metallopeptidase [Variovorax sp. dw_954]|uniref:zinc-binding metallopeptidase family protein n=1 Tax=Variovorax sp. dw_954 TaxID=2720078 RepID=UPI001BD49B48|nr:putative zinc-binding metallopeptidase [Variovorax sp. dw_954]
MDTQAQPATQVNPAAHSLATELSAPTVTRAYQCQCGRPIFLGNSECLACHTPLGFVIESLGVVPLAPASQDVGNGNGNGNEANGGELGDPEPTDPTDPALDTYTVFGDGNGRQYHRCANFTTAAGCNWMVPLLREGDEPDTLGLAPGFCLCCSATRTIPDLSVPVNGELWRKLEQGKRRLMSQLLALGLPVVTRHADAVHGLAFDFLGNVPGGPHVLTGHDTGVITLNAEEAEDAVRERIRAEMREPYRTLVGHFRHEIGHYYWDLLVFPTPWLDDFRALFGDERLDYAGALRTHYELGPPADWSVRYVTSYASSHPWEDWAETWAHYLHMADTADTALSFGVDATRVELASDLFEPADLWQPDHPDAMKFLDFLNGWVRLTNVLNELSRSMGQPDYYPFVLPRAAVGKLQFVHQVITQQRQNHVPSLEPDPAVTTQAPEPAQASVQQQEQQQQSTPVQARELSPMGAAFQVQRVTRSVANRFRPMRRPAVSSPPFGFST